MAGSQIFNSIELQREGRNTFNLSHDFKFSGNMGDIIPVLQLECIPGDKFKIGCKSLTRFMPLVSPVMSHMQLKVEYYFVANRLVWENWPDYITPGAVTNLPAFPTWDVIPSVPDSYSRLLNYMGVPDPTTVNVPIPGADKQTISALPMAAYQMIYNEYYRNNEIDPEVFFQLVDGSNQLNPDLLKMRKRGWLKDYYTSALPTAQAGPAVDIPLGDVVLKDNPAAQIIVDPANGNPLTGTLRGGNPPFPGHLQTENDSVTHEAALDPNGSLEVDPVTINTLRRAFRLQEWLERAMRGGKRMTEMIYSFFGVRNPDARLQRPEYITGVKTNVQISEVLNTTGTDDLPQGNMAGHGIAVLDENKTGSYYCTEHGYIIGVMSLVPQPSYFQGVPKHFLKFVDPYQFFWSQFANIGEQEITNNEIYAYQDSTYRDAVFGYTPRYAEYKQLPNRVAGQLQTTLKHWSLVRDFGNKPGLSSDFIHIDPTTTDRIFAVTDPKEDKLIFNLYHIIIASRQMPVYGTPTI